MITLSGKTVGLEVASQEILGEAGRNAIPLVERAAKTLAKAIQRNVSHEGAPSRPGQYPKRVTGHLHDSIGSSEAKLTGMAITAFFGVGAGPDGRAGAAKAKADGVNIFAEANSLEFGKVTKTGVRIAPRPFVRPTINQMEPAIEAMLENG